MSWSSCFSARCHGRHVHPHAASHRAAAHWIQRSRQLPESRQITQSDDVIARVEVYYLDKKVTNPFPLLLRGSALDVYSGSDARAGNYQWSRSTWTTHDDTDEWLLDANELNRVWPSDNPAFQGD